MTGVCSACRQHYQKHGELPPLLPTESKDFLFEPLKVEDEAKIKTRRTKESPSNEASIKVERKSVSRSGSVERDKKRKQVDAPCQKAKKRIKEEEEEEGGERKGGEQENSPAALFNESSVSNEPSPIPPHSPPPQPAVELPLPEPEPPAAEPSPLPPMETEDPPVTVKEEPLPPPTPEPLVLIKQEVIEEPPEIPSTNPPPEQQQCPLKSDTPPYNPLVEPPEVRYPSPVVQQHPPEQQQQLEPYHHPPIKSEPVDISPSPPPPMQQQHPYPLPSSSTALFSNSISIAMANSSSVSMASGSISASSSISLSYHASSSSSKYPPPHSFGAYHRPFQYPPFPPAKAPSPYLPYRQQNESIEQPRQSPPVKSPHSNRKEYEPSKPPPAAHQSSLYSPGGNKLPRPQPSSQQHLPPYVVAEQEKCSVEQQQQQVTLLDNEEEDNKGGFPFKGPEPEPRVEDVECHRSQSAIFLRHWNRGEFNSCARTDLTFKPDPGSQLARKQEERARKAAEKEREETKASVFHPQRLGSTPDASKEQLQHAQQQQQQHRVDSTPALRQLSEYARPHAFPPTGYATRPPQPPLPHGIDPILHYQLSSGMYGAAARESYRMEMEMEREKRERDLHDKLKAEYEMKTRAAGYDPHWIELQRRYAMAGHPFATAPPGGLYPQERGELEQRMNAERAHMLGADPLLRLQMAGLAPELHTHAHTHAHAHTHLHLHPHDMHGMGGEPPPQHPLLPPTGYAAAGPPQQRQGLVPMRPPYDEQFAHQLSAQLAQHEHMQRQIMMERERYAHMTGHPSPLMSQHEEFLRQQQQREREIKLRTLEEAARGGRPPMN